MKITMLICLLPFLFITPYSAISQSEKYADDVQSIESIMAALTEVISGEAGEVRDWKRFKHLFAADGKLIPTQITEDGDVNYNYWTPEEYIAMFVKNRSGTDFYEQELFRITEEFGNIAHCFSTYAVRSEKDGPIQRRGINSIQLFKGKSRWYIMNVFWSNESENATLPAEYLD